MFLDILFTFFVFGAVTFGFFYGIIRVIVVLVTLYVSLVLASLYFTSLGLFLENRYDLTLEIARLLSFAFVMLTSFSLLSIVGLYTFRHTRLPPKLQHFERLSGVLFGIVLAILFIGILALFFWNFALERAANHDPSAPFTTWLDRSIFDSLVVQYVGIQIAPDVSSMVGPFLPDGAKLILTDTK